MRIWIALAFVLVSASARAADDVVLFNGTDFTGWTFYLELKDYNAGGKGRISDFATVKPGGVIEINPRLHGALMTEKDYLNYRIRLEWRWVDPKAKNNTGLFVRIRPPYVWDMEHGEQAGFYQIQLSPRSTGDLWVLGAYSESKLKTDPSRSHKPFGNLESSLSPSQHIRRHLKIKDAEKPLGEWNDVDVTVDGKTIKVLVNGELVNEGTNLVDLPGRIGLESEFGPVQFRNIRLTPLP
jgi:hypothetical protein